MSLGQLFAPDEVAALAERVDDLALGRVQNPAVLFQLDTGGEYEQLPGAVAALAEATLLYRKVQGLEHDDRFARVLHHPIVREVCERMYGPHVGVSVFRAMVMNKPARQGTVLPWHQDAGDVWGLDRDPLVTLWLAIDDATPENGCMDVVPGSHRLGLLTPHGSTVPPELAEVHCPPSAVRPLPARAGELLLLHNWVIHRSGVNPTHSPRRAFTTCLMDARTISVSTGAPFPMLYGRAPELPHHHVAMLQAENEFLRDTAARSEEYALSLAAELDKVRKAYEGWRPPRRMRS
ncbi:MAG: hypothetical protein RL238_410 [Actinomycetota bacterium]